MVPVEFHILSLSVVIYFLLSSKEVYHKQLMYIAQIKLNYIFLQSSVNDYNILGDWIYTFGIWGIQELELEKLKSHN